MADDEVPSMGISSVMLLLAASQQVRRRMDEALGEFGLTLRHLGALGHLSRRPDMSYSDLARRAGVTTQSMHATVRALEERGAVRRSLPGHGHAARLEVTATGRQLLTNAKTAALRLDDELLAVLDAEQRETLRSVLLTLAAALVGRPLPDNPADG